MSISTYDPKQVALTVNGYSITGFAESSFIKVERTSESFTSKVGSQGEVVRSRLADRRAKVTVKLMQSSFSNFYLSGMLAADEQNVPGARGPWAITITDMNDTTVLSGSGWISKPAAVERGKEAGEVDWALELADLNEFQVGGIALASDSNPLPAAVQAAVPGLSSAIVSAIANASGH